MTDVPQAAIDAAYHAADDWSLNLTKANVTYILEASGLYAQGAAAERERIRLTVLGCLDCGQIHVRHEVTEPWRKGGGEFTYQSWAAPDGHAYRPAHRCGDKDVADLIEEAGHGA